MKQRARTILVLLILGAIVNVAVAWGCSAYAPIAIMEEASTRDIDEVWTRYATADAVRWKFANPMVRGLGLTVVGGIDQAVSRGVCEVRAGLPCQSLVGGRFEFVRGEIHDHGLIWVRDSRTPHVRRFLPLIPLWPGFAINTLFYAAIIWLLFAAPFALRRRRRVKRGLCPACAYPVGTSDNCTECGARVRPHGARHS